MTTGQRIKAARKKAEMTQAELAAKLGIPYQSIGQWERDIRNPKRETLERIADALGVYYLDLYGDEESSEIAAFIQSGMKLGLNAQTALQRSEFLAEYREQGYEFTSDEARLVCAYNRLNDIGQAQILLLAENMTEMRQFRLDTGEDDIQPLQNTPITRIEE